MDKQNPWWSNGVDHHIERWKESRIRWVPDIIDRISLEPFSLNFLFGPRQVGKTTALKLLIDREKIHRDPRSIFYHSCDEVLDFHELGEVLDSYLGSRDAWNIGSSIIILDEITFVDQWWRAVKSRIDSGVFSADILIITGSASMDLMTHKEMFPGRRGKGRDLLMHPLSFSQYVKVTGDLNISSGPVHDIGLNMERNRIHSRALSDLFRRYMISGGYPLSVRDLHEKGEVTMETGETYMNWLRGDWAKAGKSERFMKEVINYIIRARGTTISWNGISRETSINSPNTVRNYVEVLEGIYSTLILPLLAQDGRVMHRKNRKVHFTDPFIFRILSDYTREKLDDAWLVEGTVASHLARTADTYYWRNGTEVDIVIKTEGGQIGFEVTWGIKKWRKPWHLKEAHLIDRENIHLFLASLP